MLKRLKAPLLVALGLMALAGLYNANAAWNLRQNGDGSADFVPSSPNLSAARVGQRTLTQTIANVNLAATYYITSPITGKISQAYFVQDNKVSQAITLTLYVDQGPATAAFTPLTPTGRILNTAATGDTVTFFTNPASPFLLYSGGGKFTLAPAVKAGRPVAVRLDNGTGSTSAGTIVSGVITILVDPLD